jgi:hypothetical protein
VPVIDEFGRIAGAVLPKIDLDEAWGQLANFPMPPDDEELLSMDETGPREIGNHPNPFAESTSRYPVRQMMQLVENIAAKQTSVRHADWGMWCARLEQCLVRSAESPILAEFVQLQLNPLSPLWHAPFRPRFAESNETAEGVLYESVLKRVETAWKVSELNPIGAPE